MGQQRYRNLYCVLFLAFYIVVAQCLIIPSTGVQLCDATSPQDAQNCSPKLLLALTVSNEGDAWDIQVVLSSDDIIADKLGDSWAPEQPITISFKSVPESAFLRFPVTRRLTFQNAYESVTPGCANVVSNTSACCNGQTYSLQYNSTPVYEAWSIGSGTQEFLIDITLTQGATVKHIYYSSAGTSAVQDGPSVTGYVISSEVVGFSSYLVAQAVGNSTAVGDGSLVGLVPQRYFGSRINNLGVSPIAAAAVRKTVCSTPVGMLTSPLVVGDPYDQLAELRTSDVDGCSIREQGWQLTGTLRLKCPNRFNLQLVMLLSVQSFRIRKLYGMPVVTNSGILYRSAGQLPLLFVDVNNRGTVKGSFEVRPGQCCLTQPSTDCGSFLGIESVVHTVEPQDSARYTFVLQVAGAGSCKLDVLQHGELSVSSTVTFEANSPTVTNAPTGTGVPSPSPTSGGSSCSAPLESVTLYDGRVVCRASCSVDQLRGNQSGLCLAVNCVQKYGAGYVFNASTSLCESTAVVCNDTTVCDGALANYTNNITCGAHGTYDPGNKTCICDEGWSTSLSALQDVLSYSWCSVQSEQIFSPPGADTGSSTIFGPLAKVIIPLLIAIGLCIVCLILCAIRVVYKQYRKRQKKRARRTMRALPDAFELSPSLPQSPNSVANHSSSNAATAPSLAAPAFPIDFSAAGYESPAVGLLSLMNDADL